MIVYLHGFASSPASFKARLFRDRFAQLGIDLEVPALDQGDFEHLTISGQLRVLESALAEGQGPTVLIGSSLGGYLAALYASQRPAEALVLMAPAVEFASRWRARIPPGDWERWAGGGRLPVFHPAFGREVPIAFDLMADAGRHAALPLVRAPTLVLHGLRDEIVASEAVERFVALNGARLELFDSTHELTDVAEGLFERARAFLAAIPEIRRAWPTLAEPYTARP